MTYALGIDLGTTYTAAGLFTRGHAETVPLGSHALAIPSVAFVGDELVFGDRASLLGERQPQRLVREFKRYMGEETPLLVEDRTLTADELTTGLAGWVVDHTAELQGGPPEHIVVTCPASWGRFRRERLATAVSGRLAGDQFALLSEPEAAAIFYATRDRLPTGAVVAVYDLGGGTFDATILRKTEGAFELVGPPLGDDDVGGIDLDRRLLEHVAGEVGLDLTALDRTDPFVAQGISQLRQSVTVAKELLSTELDAVVAVMLPPTSQEIRVTRRELEALATPLVTRTVDLLDLAVERAGVVHEELHSILLVGGGSRMPLVGQVLSERFGVALAVDAHPKFAVCLGAAIVAGSHTGLADVADAFEPEDLPPSVPANVMAPVSTADPVTPAPAPPTLVRDQQDDIEDDLPPLVPAHQGPSATPPTDEPQPAAAGAAGPDAVSEMAPPDELAIEITEVSSLEVSTLAVPAESPAVPHDLLDEPFGGPPDEPDSSTLEASAWLAEAVVTPVNLESAGLLGLADVPLSTIVVRRSTGPDLRQADVLLVEGGAQRQARTLVFVVVGIIVAVGLLVLILFAVSRASAASVTSTSGGSPAAAGASFRMPFCPRSSIP